MSRFRCRSLPGLGWLPLAVALGLCPVRPAAGEEAFLDGIAAQVEGRIVLVSEVLRTVGPTEERMRLAGAPEKEIARLRADGLERLIEARLVEDMIADSELQATEEEINTTIEEIAQENGLSLEQLYASVVFHGLSVEEYRKQIKGDLEQRKLINAAVGSRVKVGEAQVKALYAERFGSQEQSGESVHVRQILRAYGGPTKRSKDTACEETREARARVASGESFEQVAAEVSDVAPRDGGDIGWLPLDSVATWMHDALEGLEAGEVSDLVVLPFGCSVLQLVERRELEPVTFEQARVTLERELWDRQLQREYRSWMEELRERSYIERRGYFADAANFGDSTFPVEAPPPDVERAAGP